MNWFLVPGFWFLVLTNNQQLTTNNEFSGAPEKSARIRLVLREQGQQKAGAKALKPAPFGRIFWECHELALHSS